MGRRTIGGLAAGRLARQAFTIMIHQARRRHGVANWLQHLTKIALPDMRTVATSDAARTKDSNAMRRTHIGLRAGPHVLLAFTTRIHHSTKQLGHAT